MSVDFLSPPRADEPLLNELGLPTTRLHRFFASLSERTQNREVSYVSIASANSPYQIIDGQHILADMDGDIAVTPPASGRFWISRKGASNTLTISGTVNGVSNPTIAFDGTGMAAAFMGGEWRWI